MGIEFTTVLGIKRTPSVDGGGYQDGVYNDYVSRCNIVTKNYLKKMLCSVSTRCNVQFIW